MMTCRVLLVFILVGCTFSDGKRVSYNESHLKSFLTHHDLSNSFFKQLLLSQKTEDENSIRSVNSNLCANHTEEILLAMENKDMWAFEIVDSWGKIPSGILMGHLADLGNFEECISVVTKLNSGSNVQGKYCLATIPMGLFGKIPSKPETRMMMPASKDESIGLQLGMCIPRSCNAVEIQDALKKGLKTIFNVTINGTIITEDGCHANVPIEFTNLDCIAIALFSFIGLIVVACSIYEYTLKARGDSVHPLPLSFSVFSNGSKLFQMQRIKSPNIIECLHGIRSLSIIWVVFGHAHVIAAVGPNINSKHIGEWTQTAYSMLLQTATISVDSFFLMSGLLVAWIMMSQLKKSNGSLNIPLIYFHRYIRLTPVVAAAILFVVTIAKFCGSGPYWYKAKYFLSVPCEQYWWSALLYVQNYVNADKLCLGHTWYLSVDTQLFLFSPFLMICLWKWGVKCIIPIVLVMLASIGYVFGMFLKHGFPLIQTSTLTDSQTRMELLYYPTHTRVSPWLVGILLGYFLYTIKDRQIQLSKFLTATLWGTSFVIIAAIIFGPYHKTQPGVTSTPVEGAFYESLSRVSWSIALAILIFLCHKGYGGIINSMLSLPFWQPISRLSYCIYLTHLIIQSIMVSNTKNDTHFSNYDVIYQFWADLSFTVMISIVVSLVFESPMIGIEKFIFSKKPSEARTETVTPEVRSA